MLTHLTQYLDKSVISHHDRTAVICGEQKISFFELAKYSKKLAYVIIGQINANINQPIAVLMEKSIGSVIADIAILYSGNAYMNLDVKAPKQRIDNIINHIKPALVITDNKNENVVIDTLPKDKIFNIDLLEYDSISSSDELLYERLRKLISVDPSCIINTSGSTGIPKGVVLNHLSFIDFTEWAIETLKIGDNEIIGSLSPTIFDIYSFELCMLMAKGSAIVIIPDKMAAFPASILQLMNSRRVSFIFWVPTIMVNIANMSLLDKIAVPDLKTVWFAGEVFPTRQFNIWKKYLPDTRFINLYGPIEITLDCTYFIINRDFRDDEPIPIGFPCNNTDVLILNNDDKPANINEEGELCVRGVSLAMGYYNSPDKTASAFVQNPLNGSYPELIYRTGDIVYKNELGEIIYKGRKDTLIKHLGYRIELGEIEHIIVNALKLVNNGCATYDDIKKEIAFFYEKTDDASDINFKTLLVEVMPKYMIPARYIPLNELPRNSNGKIDRLLLKQRLL